MCVCVCFILKSASAGEQGCYTESRVPSRVLVRSKTMASAQILLTSRCSSASQEHCPSTFADLPTPWAPMPLRERSSTVSEKHCPSTPASLPAPLDPMPLPPRCSLVSQEHCPSTPASLPAPSAPMRLLARSSLVSDHTRKTPAARGAARDHCQSTTRGGINVLRVCN